MSTSEALDTARANHRSVWARYLTWSDFGGDGLSFVGGQTWSNIQHIPKCPGFGEPTIGGIRWEHLGICIYPKSAYPNTIYWLAKFRLWLKHTIHRLESPFIAYIGPIHFHGENMSKSHKIPVPSMWFHGLHHCFVPFWGRCDHPCSSSCFTAPPWRPGRSSAVHIPNCAWRVSWCFTAPSGGPLAPRTSWIVVISGDCWWWLRSHLFSLSTLWLWLTVRHGIDGP